MGSLDKGGEHDVIIDPRARRQKWFNPEAGKMKQDLSLYL